MIHLRRPTEGRHLQAPRRPVLLVAAGILVLLAVPAVAFAFWTFGGLGTAVARTGTLDVAGAQPAARATGQDVSVSWRQSRLVGRLLGGYRAGGYLVWRYDEEGRRQEMRTGCSGRVAGPGVTMRCVERGVPEGTWAYTVTPVLGGWTGTEGPRGVVAVRGAAVTVARPVDGSATRDRRPVLRGTAAEPSPRVDVAITNGKMTESLTVTITGGSWSARPARDLPEGVYTARARRVNRVGRVTWSSPSTFTVDGSAPATTDNTATIGEAWKRTDQAVTLRPADPGGSGVAATYFTTDGSTPTTASARGATIGVGEGDHVIRYFSVDRAGNGEAVATAAKRIRVDETPPSAAVLGPLPEVRDGLVLTGGGEDALSGVVRVVYEFCAEPACVSWAPIGSSTAGPDYALAWREQPADGTYQVRARVLDAAGNATASAPQTVLVDNAPPTVTAVTSDDADGSVDAGETLTVEMSKPLDPLSVPAAGSLTLSRPSDGATMIDIPGLTDGPVDTGTAAWVEDGASLTFYGRLALVDDGWRVRFAVQACQAGCRGRPEGG